MGQVGDLQHWRVGQRQHDLGVRLLEAMSGLEGCGTLRGGVRGVGG